MAELKECAKHDMRQVRLKILDDLERVSNLASELAGGRVKTQTEGGKTEKVTLRERRRWLLVATKIAQTMKRAASSLDEDKINADLGALERLVNETRGKEEKQKRREPRMIRGGI